MERRLVVDGDSVSEIDEYCMRQKKGWTPSRKAKDSERSAEMMRPDMRRDTEKVKGNSSGQRKWDRKE